MNRRATQEEIAAMRGATSQFWKDAKDYEKLLELNRVYLRDEIPVNPYYEYSIDDETKPLVPGLLRLHDYGIMTLQSQPSDLGEPQQGNCTCCTKGRWCQVKQRAYVVFALPTKSSRIPEDHVERFVAGLQTDAHFDSLVITGGMKKCPRHQAGVSANGVVGPGITGSLPANWTTSMMKVAETQDDLVNAEWEPLQKIIVSCSCPIKKFDAHAQNGDGVMSKLDPALILIFAKSLDEDDLPGKLEQAAIRAGMGKVYKDTVRKREKLYYLKLAYARAFHGPDHLVSVMSFREGRKPFQTGMVPSTMAMDMNRLVDLIDQGLCFDDIRTDNDDDTGLSESKAKRKSKSKKNKKDKKNVKDGDEAEEVVDAAGTGGGSGEGSGLASTDDGADQVQVADTVAGGEEEVGPGEANDAEEEVKASDLVEGKSPA